LYLGTELIKIERLVQSWPFLSHTKQCSWDRSLSPESVVLLDREGQNWTVKRHAPTETERFNDDEFFGMINTNMS